MIECCVRCVTIKAGHGNEIGPMHDSLLWINLIQVLSAGLTTSQHSPLQLNLILSDRLRNSILACCFIHTFLCCNDPVTWTGHLLICLTQSERNEFFGNSVSLLIM